MEKHIMRVSYWLGVVCVVLAVVARICNVFGMPVVILHTKGNSISVQSFVDAAFLFLATAIATAGFVWFQRRNN